MAIANNDIESKTHCDRCHNKFGVGRTMSWFTTEIICLDCSDKEKEIKNNLPNNGVEFEGCGFVPDKWEEA
jgi:predicted nucleic acid-binding Zn ribbon protein